MGSQLNIKSDDAYRLASELAALTGESLTAAVTAALQERLDRKRQALMADARDPKALANRILEIGRHCAAHMEGPASSADINDMYNDIGLPI